MFDHRVSIRDPKTRRVIKYQPYRLRIKAGVKLYERPVGSGNMWLEDGTHANEHKPYTPPLVGDAAARAEISARDTKIRELEEKLAGKAPADTESKEVAAIRAESAQAAKPAVAQVVAQAEKQKPHAAQKGK